jgi:hypothetical protein
MVLTNSTVKFIALLAAVTFLAHFWHYQDLGLYEDDYFLIAQPMSMNRGDFGEFFKWHILNFGETEARPLLYIIEFSVGFLGNLIGDFKALYLLDYSVLLINNILVFVFLRVLWNQPLFLTTGTLAFALFPADTNHAYLTHIFLYSSFTFLLLAFLCYFSNQKLLSYLLIFASLLCYETMLPLFIVAPLLKNLKNPWNRDLAKEMLRHFLILSAMLVAIFILRKVTGEARVSLSMFFYRPVQTLLDLKGELLIFIPLLILGFTVFFSDLFSDLKIEPEPNTTADRIDVISLIKRLAFLGLLLSVLSYPLFFTRLATEINGRSSRVHMTAALGAAILIGLLCYGIMALVQNRTGLKHLAHAGLAVFFSLLVGFGLIVQQENQITWEYQRAFWTDIVRLCPDLEADTIILVDAPHINTGKHLHSFIQWGTPMTLRQLYKFPEEWERLDELPETQDKPRWYFWRKYTLYPKVYRLNPNWQDTLISQGKLDFNPRNQAFEYFLQWEPPRLIDSHNVILLEEREGQLTRRSEPLAIGNQTFEFKPRTKATLQSFEKHILYSSFIKQ